MRLLDVPGLLATVSKAIHLEEWCSTRDRCSGTSASSDAHARVALKAIDDALPTLLQVAPPLPEGSA